MTGKLKQVEYVMVWHCPVTQRAFTNKGVGKEEGREGSSLVEQH